MHARIGWQNLRTSEFLDKGDYMLITGTDFVDGSIDYSTCHYVARERYEQDRNIQISNGSILITKDGTEYSANGRPLVTVEKSTQYADQAHLAQKLNTLKSPLWI